MPPTSTVTEPRLRRPPGRHRAQSPRTPWQPTIVPALDESHSTGRSAGRRTWRSRYLRRLVPCDVLTGLVAGAAGLTTQLANVMPALGFYVLGVPAVALVWVGSLATADAYGSRRLAVGNYQLRAVARATITLLRAPVRHDGSPVEPGTDARAGRIGGEPRLEPHPVPAPVLVGAERPDPGVVGAAPAVLGMACPAPHPQLTRPHPDLDVRRLPFATGAPHQLPEDVPVAVRIGRRPQVGDDVRVEHEPGPVADVQRPVSQPPDDLGASWGGRRVLRRDDEVPHPGAAARPRRAQILRQLGRREGVLGAAGLIDVRRDGGHTRGDRPRRGGRARREHGE